MLELFLSYCVLSTLKIGESWPSEVPARQWRMRERLSMVAHD